MLTHESRTPQSVVKYGMPASAIPYQATIQLIFGFIGKLYAKVQKMIRRFQNDVISFYDPEAIEKGCILAKDRRGEKTCFPLLTVSAVILELPASRSIVFSVEEIAKKMSQLKKYAKSSLENTYVVRFTEGNELITIDQDSLKGESMLSPLMEPHGISV